MNKFKKIYDFFFKPNIETYKYYRYTFIIKIKDEPEMEATSSRYCHWSFKNFIKYEFIEDGFVQIGDTYHNVNTVEYINFLSEEVEDVYSTTDLCDIPPSKMSKEAITKRNSTYLKYLLTVN